MPATGKLYRALSIVALGIAMGAGTAAAQEDGDSGSSLFGPIEKPRVENSRVGNNEATPVAPARVITPPPISFTASPSSPSDLVTPPQTAKELRVARAQFKAAQRMARLEQRLWMGYEPLRPQWNAVPSMSSRYAPHRVLVPIYHRR